jgi:NADPH2:quinone reductase
MVYHLTAADRARATSTLTRLLERGALQHLIDQRLPLEQIAAAHERVESGQAVGNVVLHVGE